MHPFAKLEIGDYVNSVGWPEKWIGIVEKIEGKNCDRKYYVRLEKTKMLLGVHRNDIKKNAQRTKKKYRSK